MPERPPSARSTASDLPTVCCLCSHNCGLRVDVADGRIARIRPDERNPITRGYVCHKGYSLPHYLEHAQRLTQPLRRRADGAFDPVSWTVAVAEIGQRLRSMVREHSPRSIALMGCGGQGNHMDGAYAISFLQGLGSPWWFSAFAQEKIQHPLVDRWMAGAPAMSYFISDAERSRYLIMIGTNPWLSHRGRCPRDLISAIQRDAGRTLVVIDPRRTETAARADIHLAPRPGSDCYLLLALCAAIVQGELHDQAFLNERTTGFAQVAALLRGIDLSEMARRSDLALERIVQVAEGFARTRPASVFFDLGVEQTPFSTLNAYLIRLLSALTGNLGREGGNVYTIWPLAPRLDLLNRLPLPCAPRSGIRAVPIIGPVGMFSTNLFPEEVLHDGPERIRAVIVDGANPLLSYADTARYREAFRRLELKVVIDPAFTETAAEADYVLPTPAGYEKWEWSSFPNGFPQVYLQLRPPIVPGPPEALPEAEIYARIARSAGVTPTLPAQAMTLARRPPGALLLAGAGGLASLARGRSLQQTLGGLLFSLYDLLRAEFPAPSLTSVWALSHLFASSQRDNVVRALEASGERTPRGPLGQALFRRILDHPGGVEIARLDPTRNLEEFCTLPGHRLQLAPGAALAEVARALRAMPPSDRAFPLVLYTGERTRWNANTIHRDPAWRKGQGPHCALHVHPQDAAALGLVTGEPVQVATPRGEVVVPWAPDDKLRVGQVSLPHGFGQRYPDADGKLREDGVNVNALTDAAARDPLTGVPHHKHVTCRVRPVRAQPPESSSGSESETPTPYLSSKR